MIYAYCLSLFSMHFFSSHSIANFKLRLINQQTGDCTDSVILHAGKLTPSTFPVPIKLKGGQRLLVKVKLLSLPSKNSEVLVGEGVVSFDKNSIDNTLRVPIYDKQRGVEEVAICSIDFFLSGFEVDKHNSINIDKSRSRFDDLRQRTQDAVYSQMSYTLESERESHDSKNNSKISKPNLAIAATAPLEGIHNTSVRQSKPKQVIFEQKRSQSKLDQSAKEIKLISPRNNHQVNENEDEEQSLLKKDLNKIQVAKPFTLENNVYLQQNPSKKLQLGNKRLLKQTKKKPPSNLRKKLFEFQSQEEFPRSEKHMQLSPQSLRKTVKQNEQVLSQLKKYLSNMEKQQQSPKHKKRRNLIKIQQFSAYKSQNNYVKYHVQLKPPPKKVIKNLRSIHIIQNQIKQPCEQKVVAQIIDQIILTSLIGTKLVTFDVNGFRAYCISNGQSQSVASIMVPTSQNAVKVKVKLRDQGDFQGVIGFQEGVAMNINLNRLNATEQYILQKSEFKLLFDIKGTDSKSSAKNTINFHNNDVSFRQPYELIAPQDDIKIRVGQLGCQPWGFIKSYAEGVVLSPQSKEVLDRIDQQLPPLKEQITRPKALSQSKRAKKNVSSIKRRESALKKQQSKTRSISSDYLQSPIKKVKPVPSHIRRETESINSIRNGNRNNYRFQDNYSTKHIKQAWEQILFKRKLEEQQQQAPKMNIIYPLKTNNYRRNNQKQGNNFSTDSENQSISTFQQKKVNKIYKFIGEQRKPRFPLRTFTLKISNLSITQPQALVDSRSNVNIGKFVKFSIKGGFIYFTEVIFSGNYNSILWKLQGCIFEELTGNEKLIIEIYQTLNNRITLIGISFIRVNRIYFLRSNHIYNGTISHQNNLLGEFTLGFEIEENRPFEIIQEQDQDTINHVNKPPQASRSKLKTFNHQSQKNLKQKINKQPFKKRKTEVSDDGSQDYEILRSNQMLEQMSMPIGISQE